MFSVETVFGPTFVPCDEDRFQNPRGIVIDNEDNLFVADCGNSRIRKIDPEGRLISYFEEISLLYPS